tara:strand:+ start:345 stop:512 length:168 start_codon:yes stop_codon:yes gene_type:complete
LHAETKSKTAFLSILINSALIILDGCPTPSVHMAISCPVINFSYDLVEKHQLDVE